MTYPSDLTEAQWAVIEPLAPADKARGSNNPKKRNLFLNGRVWVVERTFA